MASDALALVMVDDADTAQGDAVRRRRVARSDGRAVERERVIWTVCIAAAWVAFLLRVALP